MTSKCYQYNFMLKLFLCVFLTETFADCLTFKQNSDEKCEKRIYESCTHKRDFTDEEIENARIYIQNQFTRNADLPPVRPPCARLRLRRDFKCLTDEERQQFVDVIKQLYTDGSIGELADLHAKYWPNVHKTVENTPWHKYMVNLLEQKMLAINPNMTIPYWDNTIDFAHPERSILWKYMGTAGNIFNGYCVIDGMFANLSLSRCVKRDWIDNVIPVWESPEMIESLIQRSSDYSLYNILLPGVHSLTHLNVGGYYGDMSVETAAYDIIFYLYHHYLTDVILPKIQLHSSSNLTPLSYNIWPVIDQGTGYWKFSSIENDALTYWSNVTVLETFQIGFGEFCSVTDRIVDDINRVLNNDTDIPVPKHFSKLPDISRLLFYPALSYQKITPFHLMASADDWGDCNQNEWFECKPIPKFKGYLETPEGQRLIAMFGDITPIIQTGVLTSQTYFHMVTDELNKYRYCSPFVV